VRRVLVTIAYDVEPAKRDAYLSHVREMKEHARGTLSLDYEVYEDLDHPGAFTEVFTCASADEYEALDEKQDDAFREMVARLERFTDLRQVKYRALGQLP
jgi:quinol monooxygenase YgiN